MGVMNPPDSSPAAMPGSILYSITRRVIHYSSKNGVWSLAFAPVSYIPFTMVLITKIIQAITTSQKA